MKKIMRKTLSFIFALLLVLSGTSLFSCEKYYYVTFSAVLFDANLSVVTTDRKLDGEVIDKIDEIVYSLSKEFSLKGNGFLSRFNSAEVGESIALPPIAKELLERIFFAADVSDKFNPTVLPFLKLWHFTEDTAVKNEDFIPPTIEEIDGVKSTYSFNPSAVKISEDGAYAVKTENVNFEVGAIVKGFATDLIYSVLKTAGINSGYVNFGDSSIAFLDSHTMSVTHPENTREKILKVGLSKNAFVSTSGTYRTYYEKDGVKYSHIIDAETGSPTESGALSAVVISDKGYFSDAMSTAFMLLSVDQAKTLIKKMSGDSSFGDFAVFVIYNKDGEKIILTNKKQGDFTLLDSSYTVVNPD